MRSIARIVRREPVVTVFLGIALLWGFVVTVLIDLAGWDLLAAPASIVVLVGAFGWYRRGPDSIIKMIGLAAICAYVAIVGTAVVRLAELNVSTGQANTELGAQWPSILIGGIPFALMSAIFIAMPVSMLPARRQPVSERDQRFLRFILMRAHRHAGPSPASSRILGGATIAGSEPVVRL
jgi:hypothetical protein